jgi:hypothetical protein
MQSFGAMFDKLGQLLVSAKIGSTVVPVGAPNQLNGQLAPTSVAATAVIARSTRTEATLLNTGTVTVFVGPAGVTAATGFPIAVNASLTVTWVGLIQMITASATGALNFWEEWN